MARKRKKLKHLPYESPEYWDKLLAEDGLSMEAGTTRRITYVGDTKALEDIEARQEFGSDDACKSKSVTYHKDSVFTEE